MVESNVFGEPAFLAPPLGTNNPRVLPVRNVRLESARLSSQLPYRLSQAGSFRHSRDGFDSIWPDLIRGARLIELLRAGAGHVPCISE